MKYIRLSLLITCMVLVSKAEAIDIMPLKERRGDLKMVVHDILDGARLSAIGEVDGSMFTFDNTFRGTDVIDVLFIDYQRLPHIVHVRGSSYEQMNRQYAKLTERFKREELVILFFDRYSFFERESGYVINTHIQFVRAMRSGNVTRGDYDPIDSARFTIALGKRLTQYKYPGFIELKPKVAEILERYVDGKGARLSA